MRTLLAVVVVVALGAIFLIQKRNAPLPSTSSSHQVGTSRPVNEHDWAKQALDRTAKVRGDVARHRAENEPQP